MPVIPSPVVQYFEGDLSPELGDDLVRAVDRIVTHADNVRRLAVRTNADTPHDAILARAQLMLSRLVPLLEDPEVGAWLRRALIVPGEQALFAVGFGIHVDGGRVFGYQDGSAFPRIHHCSRNRQ